MILNCHWADHKNRQRSTHALAITCQGSSLFWCPIYKVDRGSHAVDCPQFSHTLYSPRLALTPQHRVSQPLLPSQPLIHSPPPLYLHHNKSALTLTTACCTIGRTGIAPMVSTANLSIAATDGHPVTHSLTMHSTCCCCLLCYHRVGRL